MSRYSRRAVLLAATGASLAGAAAAAPRRSQQSPSSVSVGGDGRLVYAADARGNRVPDFSNVGYRGGDAPLPEPGSIPVRATVAPLPKGEDAGPALQAALDAVGKLPPDARGLRGAVLLKRGVYPVRGVLRLRAGGVVLRGEGEGADGTVLVATGKGQRSLVQVGGEGEAKEVPGTRRDITDAYVPVGARTFHVADASPFKVGDAVIVRRLSTAEWIRAIGMDRIPIAKDKSTVQWKPGSKDLLFDRVITRIEGNAITVDAPLCNAFEKDMGPGVVYKYAFPGRIENVGVEDLRGDSEYVSPTDEDHGWKFVSLGAVQNAWVRRVTAVHYGYSSVSVERPAKWVTVSDCTCLDPVSQISGGRRYAFNLVGQLTLFERCRSRDGRHDFVLGSTVAGPNAFVDCRAENAHADTGPHHRWSVGCLFDKVTVTSSGSRRSGVGINIRDRGNSGTGHGWVGANCVVWNCEAPEMIVQSPPTAQNWAIGCRTPSKKGNGVWESFGTPVLPKSLYRAQLTERQKQKR